MDYYLHEPDFEKRDSLIAQIESLEHDNDDLTHEIFLELGILASLSWARFRRPG